MSYYVSADPRADKTKYYYTQGELFTVDEIVAIEDLYTSNTPFNQIQTIINNLGSGNNVFNNGFDPCGCASLIQLLQIQMNLIIDLESKIPKVRFNMIDPFDTVIPTEVKLDYVKYIQKYGVPDDGVFLPELLAEFQ